MGDKMMGDEQTVAERIAERQDKPDRHGVGIATALGIDPDLSVGELRRRLAIADFVINYRDNVWQGKVKLETMDDYDPFVRSGCHAGVQEFIALALQAGRV